MSDNPKRGENMMQNLGLGRRRLQDVGASAAGANTKTEIVNDLMAARMIR